MKIDLEKFVRVYISEALEIAKDTPLVDEFDEQVRESVSKKIGVSKNFVRHVHHAFHWEFFCNEDSVLEYAQASKNGDKDSIKLKRQYTSEDIINIKSSILRDYREYLESRVSCFRE